MGKVTPLKLAVLVSGGGSNLQAIIDACKTPDYPAEIVLVFSNQLDAGGLERARRAGIRAEAISHKGFEGGREAYDSTVSNLIEESGADLVVLAGYLRLVSESFVTRWEGRLINIHPSLLPSFKGLHVHQAALDAGVKYSGCTVHYVVPEVDSGPIIAQAVVPVLPGDDAGTLAQRILKQEHRIYPQVIRWIAEGRVSVDEAGIVTVADADAPDFAQINPVPEPN
ncbi:MULTISPECIES: phosphoribosylglycinamide formyltransferase [Thalassospira]|uniref:phosphoribosylglycinamide formyltransferase n=1 Tax=Thalassospira TaxID=168934 RepID=UPI0008DCACF1|nr:MULTISPECIES: phosphoribosylglycinamide formyltransferase [Thalassospira]MAB33217.1 phosphoribosylglycinamide formyltransferase [Thalassospira sp.]MDM7976962.1 phosphoribosylglycinamide formyltransferase [Thalassospira xiamenensis]OHY99323.1 phosphoribosylglycinamide formyltransferase [Thalassospira sp. MIT1004]HBS21884.1 phosphoribosylglycinamide formyltransferase [Thalassospira sp.]|tara:strand:- start:269 stop:943 length:675 start_codon:yes stop_codon:yes gene_type:complete